jgi:hypothetical protein
MATIINASVSQGLVMTSDLSGQLQLQSNGVAVTVPAVAGTMMVSGNMPAFAAYQATSAQSVSANTFTKITLNSIATTGFDTNSNFSTANSRFTPTVAGYYQINASVSTTTALASNIYFNAYITKNGSVAYQTTGYPSPVNSFSAFIAGVVYCNGSTDYIELCAQSNSAYTVQLGTSNTFLNGFLARSA